MCMFALGKRPGEEHSEYIQHSTEHAEDIYRQAGGQSILVAFLKRWIDFVWIIFANAGPACRSEVPETVGLGPT